MLFQSAHIRYCKTNKYRLSACTYFDDSYDTYIYLIVKSHSHEHLRSSCKEKKKKEKREIEKDRKRDAFELVVAHLPLVYFLVS